MIRCCPKHRKWRWRRWHWRYQKILLTFYQIFNSPFVFNFLRVASIFYSISARLLQQLLLICFTIKIVHRTPNRYTNQIPAFLPILFFRSNQFFTTRNFLRLHIFNHVRWTSPTFLLPSTIYNLNLVCKTFNQRTRLKTSLTNSRSLPYVHYTIFLILLLNFPKSKSSTYQGSARLPIEQYPLDNYLIRKTANHMTSQTSSLLLYNPLLRYNHMIHRRSQQNHDEDDVSFPLKF